MCLITRLVGTLLLLFLLCYEKVMGRIDASIPCATINTATWYSVGWISRHGCYYQYILFSLLGPW
jgi:hypothetical protein